MLGVLNDGGHAQHSPSAAAILPVAVLVCGAAWAEIGHRADLVPRQVAYAAERDSHASDERKAQGKRGGQAERRQRAIEATGQVVRSVSRAAELNAAAETATRRTGDELTDLYIQQAALAAAQLPQDIRPSAFLTGIGIALDDSDLVLQNPLTRGFCGEIETPAERAARLQTLGSPTMRSRRDLAQHFAVSACLTAQAGALVADAAGLAKELLDAESGSGFSFADLAADQAGIRFAQHVLSGQMQLEQLARGFSVADYLPDVAGLPEQLSAEAFQRDYAGASAKRLDALRADIRARVHALPPYRSPGQDGGRSP